jgi:hypothetical protein
VLVGQSLDYVSDLGEVKCGGGRTGYVRHEQRVQSFSLGNDVLSLRNRLT